MAFLALGDVIAAALFQTGRFRPQDSMYVWGILAGSAVGLLASTLGRLYSSTYYALRDTRTPLRFAIVRVVLTTGLGYLCAIPLPRWLGIDPRWGVAGTDGVGGRRGLGGVHAAAAIPEPADRLDGAAGEPDRAALGVGSGGAAAGVGGQGRRSGWIARWSDARAIIADVRAGVFRARRALVGVEESR